MIVHIAPVNMPIPSNMNNTDKSTPLTPEQQVQFADAEKRLQKIRRASKIAAFNGYSIAIIAAFCLPFAAFGDLTSLILAPALAAIAYNEFRGRAMFHKLDLRAPTYLGYNQLAFLTIIITYCIYQLCNVSNEYQQAIQETPDLQSMLEPIGDLIKIAVTIIYITVIVLSIVYQGGKAIYYFTRKKYMQIHIKETPQWIIDLQRNTISH